MISSMIWIVGFLIWFLLGYMWVVNHVGNNYTVLKEPWYIYILVIPFFLIMIVISIIFKKLKGK